MRPADASTSCHAPAPQPGKGRGERGHPSRGEHKSLCINYEQSRQISAINYQNPRANCNLLQLLLLLPPHLSLSLSMLLLVYNASKHTHSHTLVRRTICLEVLLGCQEKITQTKSKDHTHNTSKHTHIHTVTHPHTRTQTHVLCFVLSSLLAFWPLFLPPPLFLLLMPATAASSALDRKRKFQRATEIIV